MNSAAKTVLILGGGFGGIVAACRLRRALPREHRVILVERETTHVFAPSLLWLMIGERKPAAISRPIAALTKRGIEVVRGNIEKIDPARRAVSVNGRELAGDYLIVALGAELAAITFTRRPGPNRCAMPVSNSIRAAWSCSSARCLSNARVLRMKRQCCSNTTAAAAVFART